MSIGKQIRQFVGIKATNFRFQWRAAKKYYPHSARFALCDIALGVLYFFFNPYRICRKSGEIYGETPLESLHRITSFCSVSKKDVWIELGSGRGKGAFWVANFVGCRTIAVEKVRLFHTLAIVIRSLFSVTSLEFLRQDILETDFSQASFVYLYSTCTEEKLLSCLTKKMGAMRPFAKVITISSPLPSSSLFQTVGAFPISFPWGDTQAYINERQPS